MPPHLSESIILWRHALRAPIEACAAQPCVRLWTVMQDGAALLYPKSFAGMKAHTDKITSVPRLIHPLGKPPRAIPYRQRLELVGADPVFIPECRPAVRVDDAHRDADVGALGDFNANPLRIITTPSPFQHDAATRKFFRSRYLQVPCCGQQQGHGATIHGNRIRRPGIFAKRPLEVFRYLMWAHSLSSSSRNSSTDMRLASALVSPSSSILS